VIIFLMGNNIDFIGAEASDLAATYVGMKTVDETMRYLLFLGA